MASLDLQHTGLEERVAALEKCFALLLKTIDSKVEELVNQKLARFSDSHGFPLAKQTTSLQENKPSTRDKDTKVWIHGSDSSVREGNTRSSSLERETKPSIRVSEPENQPQNAALRSIPESEPQSSIRANEPKVVPSNESETAMSKSDVAGKPPVLIVQATKPTANSAAFLLVDSSVTSYLPSTVSPNPPSTDSSDLPSTTSSYVLATGPSYLPTSEPYVNLYEAASLPPSPRSKGGAYRIELYRKARALKTAPAAAPPTNVVDHYRKARTMEEKEPSVPYPPTL